MAIALLRRNAGLAAGALLLMSIPALAQDAVPVPTPPAAGEQRPAAATPADTAPADPAIEGPATPLDRIPLPEERPAVPGDASGPAPGEAPAAGAPDAAAAPASPPKPEPAPEVKPAPDTPAPPADAEAPAEATPAPAGPQPAYVPPEKARMTPEPGAPQTPEMEVTPAETVEAAAAVEDAVLCEAELKQRGAEFTVGPTIAEGDCGVLRPVNLTKLSSGVTVSPATQMLCRTALALDIWMTERVVPAAKAELDGAKIASLAQASTYVCRARASESKISEHSRGSAIDIGGFQLSGGKTLTIGAAAPATPEDRFEAAIRRAACGPFKTVLGPGTDSDHGTHLHLDIAARSNGATYCR